MPDDQAGRWLPLAAAGQALGLTPDTLRKQAKRGLRDARRDNHGLWLILVGADGTWDNPVDGGLRFTSVDAADAERARWDLRTDVDALARQARAAFRPHRHGPRSSGPSSIS